MLKVHILGHSCISSALVDLVWALESVILTSLRGDFYGQAFWKTLLRTGEVGLWFGCEGSGLELARVVRAGRLMGRLEVPEGGGCVCLVLGSISSL